MDVEIRRKPHVRQTGTSWYASTGTDIADPPYVGNGRSPEEAIDTLLTWHTAKWYTKELKASDFAIIPEDKSHDHS